MAEVIMTADDSASVRQMVGFTLKGAGYVMVQAVDGQDAPWGAARRRRGHVADNNLNMLTSTGLSFHKEGESQCPI